MKKINIFATCYLLLATCFLLISCSDQFLQDKKLYGTYSSATVYTNYETATNRVDDIYRQLLPGQKEGNGAYSLIVSVGSDDDQAKSTEEYGGISKFEDNLSLLDYRALNGWEDHFYVENKEISPWGQIRDINDLLEGMAQYSTMTESENNEINGQAYFLRAWRYWTMVRWLGGVPIIDHVQNAMGDSAALVVDRSTTKECIEFIISDLDKAIKMLPSKWMNSAQDWGRVTAGAAAALKGRVLLWWASPLFNRSDDQSRWQKAYEANKEALDMLAQGGYGLAYENNPGAQSENAANWAKIFLNNQGTDGSVNEAVFVTLYNSLVQQENNSHKWNSWENDIRPKTAAGNGGKAATAEMVGLFPMADGKISGEGSQYTLNTSTNFFLNRDPRFYRTFAFPGVYWKFNGKPCSTLAQQVDDKGNYKTPAYTYSNNQEIWPGYPYDGDNFQLWSYCWYAVEASKADVTKSGYGADGLNGNSFAVYVRKRSDDLDLNPSPLYEYTYSDGVYNFKRSAAPFMEMRYAEVLLNFAEAAAAVGEYQESLDALKRIRSRVYQPELAESNYGLENTGDRATMIKQVLFERQIELAYEGKRFDDMRRWMLFDGGTGVVDGAPATWTLSGFNGNTCNYLGVAPSNGVKHHYIEMYPRALASADQTEGVDPILKTQKRPAAYDLMNCSTADMKSMNSPAYFFAMNFARTDRNADGNNDAQVPTFQPYYYFLGLNYSAMVNNPVLHQTIGWEDYGRGGNGTFDPLAE